MCILDTRRRIGSRGLSTQPIFRYRFELARLDFRASAAIHRRKTSFAFFKIDGLIKIIFFKVYPIPKLDRWSDIGSGAESSDDTHTHIYRYFDK